VTREVRGFGGCTRDDQRGSAREHDQIFPHGTLLDDVQESNAPAVTSAVMPVTSLSIVPALDEARP
jgi:hypothetical protein